MISSVREPAALWELEMWKIFYLIRIYRSRVKDGTAECRFAVHSHSKKESHLLQKTALFAHRQKSRLQRGKDRVHGLQCFL